MLPILVNIHLTTIIITFTYQLGGTTPSDLNSNNNMGTENLVRHKETNDSSINYIIPLRILTDSVEPNRVSIKTIMKQFSKKTHGNTDKSSNKEIDNSIDMKPTDSSLDVDYTDDVNVIEDKKGLFNAESEEPKAFHKLNHEVDSINYEGDNIDFPKDTFLSTQFKTDNEIALPSRRINSHSIIPDLTRKSGIPRAKPPNNLNRFSPYVPTFAGGYASNPPKLNDKNIFHSFIPQYRSPFPASQMIYTPPSYSYFLPLPAQITKINSAEMITPNITRFSKPPVIRSSVDLIEDAFNITENELILNNIDSNAYSYEPLQSLDTDSNDENVPDLTLIFKKLFESSINPKQLNTGGGHLL